MYKIPDAAMQRILKELESAQDALKWHEYDREAATCRGIIGEIREELPRYKEAEG